jgi:hypothetical protein
MYFNIIDSLSFSIPFSPPLLIYSICRCICDHVCLWVHIYLLDLFSTYSDINNVHIIYFDQIHPIYFTLSFIKSVFFFIIVVLGLHCDIYESSCNIS